MRVASSLVQIRVPWIARVSHSLANGEGVREAFSAQLERFFDLLLQAVETGDPAWLDPALGEWAEARTQTELDSRQASLPPILDQILLLTFEVGRELLPSEEALDLFGALLPAYVHAFEYSARQEMDLLVDHVSHELIQAQDTLERLDKSKSDFISIAAHELKTPLTLIEGYASMLRELELPGERAGRGRTEHGRSEREGGAPLASGSRAESVAENQAGILLDGIDNGSRRLRAIVDDMIDVSMIDNNLLSLHFQPVWIQRLLHVVQEELSKSVSERHQSLEVRLFDGSSEMTFGDDERLFQALRNVISNAIKYTPDGGRIVVDGRKLPGFLEITVADTGIGIAPEDQARVFEKFGRVGNVSLHSSGKTKFKGGGPGLGLPIARGILEAHGGAIWVESEGHDEVKCPGSTFHILLPLRSAPPDDKTARLFGTPARGVKA